MHDKNEVFTSFLLLDSETFVDIVNCKINKGTQNFLNLNKPSFDIHQNTLSQP